MTPQEQIANTILRLENSGYFEVDEDLIEEMSWNLLKTRFSGIAINGPNKIDIDQNKTFPLILGTRRSTGRNFSTDIEKNCVIILSDLKTGKVVINQAFPEKEHVALIVPIERSIGRGSMDNVANTFLLNLKDIFNVDWGDTIYSTSVISYDWISNTILTNITSSKKMEEKIQLHVHPKPNPLSGETITKFFFFKKQKEAFPSYENFDHVPSPTTEGCNFLISTSKTNDAILFGSFIIKTKELFLLDKPEVIKLRSSQIREVIAIVPITLLILHLDMSTPIRFDWNIPVYEQYNKNPENILKGHFAIDIRQEYKKVLPPDRYIGYIVLDGKVYGPQSFEWH